MLFFWSGEADGESPYGEESHLRGEKIHEKIIQEITTLRPDKSFRIMYLRELLPKWIEAQPIWFKKPIEKEEEEINKFFDWLLKRTKT